MPIFGKLSPTNGCAISVDDERLRDRRITASLLSNSGQAIHAGTLNVTKGKFINAPKDSLRAWVAACGRDEEDIRGPRRDSNTVYYYYDELGAYNLHFAEYEPGSSVSRESSIEPPPLEKASRDRPPEYKTEQVTSSPGPPIALQSLGGLRTNGWRDVPTQSGIYWWYFPQICLEKFGIQTHCNVDALNLRRAANGKVCLYVGVANSLQQRVEWHADQALTASALESGFISTFRKTLLALNWIDYQTGFDQINQFMDGLDISWLPTGDLHVAEQMETAELNGEFHYPLNIRGNPREELQTYIQFLKRRRKEYKDHFLKG